MVAEKFQWSSSTIYVYFHAILKAVMLMSNDIDDQQFNNGPEQTRNSNRHRPFLQIVSEL